MQKVQHAASIKVGARALAKHYRRFRRDLRAVTPVVGSILILGITVMGIAAVMLWGAPALQRIQEQNAQGAMLGEFQEVRKDSLVLSITDSSRLPRLTLDQGNLELREGTRIQVTSNHDPAAPDCDMHVKDWGVGANNDRVEVTFTDCRDDADDFVYSGAATCVSGDDCFRIYSVTGTQRASQDITVFSVDATTAILDVTDSAGDPVDFTQGNWLFELADAGAANTYSQAWLMDNQALHWELSGTTTVTLHLEAGALFSGRDNTIFLQEEPPMAEEAFGSNDFVLRLPTFIGDEAGASGRQTPTMYLGLIGNHPRIETEDATRLRFDFEGDFAQAWCNTLDARDSFLDEGVYQPDSDYDCDTGGTDGRRSLIYESRTDKADPATAQPFVFEFIHARIFTDL